VRFWCQNGRGGLASLSVAVGSRTAPKGSPAPGFTLTQVGGARVSLTDFRGRPVVLAFLRGFL